MSKKSGNACRGNCYEITNPAYCCILPWESLKNIWEINIKPHNCILLAFLQAAERVVICRFPKMNGDFRFFEHGYLCCWYFKKRLYELGKKIKIHSKF